MSVRSVTQERTKSWKPFMLQYEVKILLSFFNYLSIYPLLFELVNFHSRSWLISILDSPEEQKLAIKSLTPLQPTLTVDDDVEFTCVGRGENSKLTPICYQCTLSLPPKSIRKPLGLLMFSGGRENVHWEQWVSKTSLKISFFRSPWWNLNPS